MIGINKAKDKNKPDTKAKERGTAFFGVKKRSGNKSKRQKLSPGEIRVQKDISELDGGNCVSTHFPDPNNLMNFLVTVTPDEGYWRNYSYQFQFKIPNLYPHEPPKIRCLDKIYHPNIDVNGSVCLNILRTGWKPVLDVNSIIYGLIVLFTNPNGEDPLNISASKLLRENPEAFKRNVSRSLRGLSVDGEDYPVGNKNK